jgi:hypothetical protein
MAKSFLASDRDVLLKIIIPAASPIIFSGLRLGVSAGFIGAILSELKITPTGVFVGAEALSKHHRSRLYNNAPMPFAIFYDGHYAIHGTDQIKRLGAPASNGCVRLHPDNAAILFQMVKAEGKDNMRIEIVQ